MHIIQVSLSSLSILIVPCHVTMRLLKPLKPFNHDIMGVLIELFCVWGSVINVFLIVPYPLSIKVEIYLPDIS